MQKLCSSTNLIPGHIEIVNWGKSSNLLANIMFFNLPATPKMDPQDRNTPVGVLDEEGYALIHQNTEERTESSVPALVRASVEPKLNRNSATTFITTELTEAEYEFNELPVKRRRIRRNLELNGCFCGSMLDSSMAGVIECKRIGCKTQWVSRVSYWTSVFCSYICSQYHMECITDDLISKNWVCEACKVSWEGPGSKHSRR